MTVSLAQDGRWLGLDVGEERAREMLKEAGFTKVEVKQLPHDIFNNYFLITKN
jgi:N-acetylglutamate synthase-like GNAT family acetyltransferase